MWAFSTDEKVWKLSESTRALSSQRRRIVKCAFKRRRFFILQFKDFFVPGSTTSIRDIGKWCFSQFKFRFASVFSPFRVSEQVGSVTIRSRFNTCSQSFQLSKIRLFLCLFALKSPLFCLQILIRCSHKQTVWHWQARHHPRVNAIGKLRKL